ncbi:hypothetical protein Hypma_004633 [Hypsizygus marmoreus]|uniref:Uncharacterized protein n=1 Tax=Hypsizygus marmoreus TaxID=39966 RepID=A0A369J069_HYPMA|nr:hypothetical protein Hypma_004633 [Hypsizygus marmoreus]
MSSPSNIHFRRFLCIGDPEIGPLDALYICSLDLCVGPGGEEGRWVVSTPNATWLPKVKLGIRKVYLRADGRFGLEDRSIWPQFYSLGFEYIICIPRKPDNANDPMSVLWWTPKDDDLMPIQGNSVDITLYNLHPARMAHLQVWRDRLVNEANKYQKTHKRSPLLGLITTALRHTWIRITLAPMTKREVVQLVTELQRFCLDTQAWLDYVLIYTPRLYASDDDLKNLPVAHHLMGAVTESDAIAMQLFQMRIPVFHVRPSFKLSKSMNIVYNVPYQLPVDVVLGSYPGEPFPVICHQSPGTVMLQATQQIGCIFLDLFKDVSTATMGGSPEDEVEEPETGKASSEKTDNRYAPYPPSSSSSATGSRSSSLAPPQSSSSATPSGSSSLTALSSTTVPERSRARAGVAGSSSKGAPRVKGSRGHDKFSADVAWHLMPVAIPAWAEALSSVKRSDSYKAPHKIGYAFPEANMIAGGENNRHKYLVTWLSRRAACIWRETAHYFVSTARASSQDWRDFLSRSLSVGPTSTKLSIAQRRKRKAEAFFVQVGLTAMPSTVYWNAEALPVEQMLAPSTTTAVLWDLCEHNFRFEVLALDHVLRANDWGSEQLYMGRDEVLRQAFFDNEGEPGGSYLVPSVPSQDFGLASSQLNVRRVFVDNLRQLMTSWPQAYGKALPMGPALEDNVNFARFELAVASFYCQSFYDVFGHAASIPHSVNAA